MQAERAQVGSGTADLGATIFAGDAARTAAQGTLRLQMGKAQVYLGENSQAQFGESEGRVTAHLTAGRAGFTAQGEEAVLIYAAGAWIRPEGIAATHGEVTLTGSNEILITSLRGSVEVLTGNERLVVPQGETYRLLTQGRDEVEGVGKEQVRRARWARIATGVTISAAIITLILLRNAVSPSIP
jgi:hypothetical protein